MSVNQRAEPPRAVGRSRAAMRRWATASLVSLTLAGCGGPLLRLAKQESWAELDRQARASKQVPRGKAARAWAQALVELGQVEEARAVLLRDFRHGGQEPSLLALAALEQRLGLRGIAAAHYTRLLDLDLDSTQQPDVAPTVCGLLRERARAEVAIGEALAADTDMRRLALVCPADIREADRSFLASIEADARAQAKGQRALGEALAPSPEALATIDARLAEQLELARKRSPRAMIGLAEAERIQLTPDDVAVLLAAEFAGGLGPGLISDRRLSAWVGDNPTAAVEGAIDTLPDGAREYALLRLAGVRASDRATSERQTWIVAAMNSLAGQGSHEAAHAWRVAAAAGDLTGAEFALNTNLRDMIPVAEPGPDGVVVKPVGHWSLRVPVDRRSFDLLLTLARLFELRAQPVLALELRRSVIVAGHEVGLAQVGAAAAEEVLRQLALGQPWQALALAEVVPGPMVDEVLPAVASSLGLAREAGLAEGLEDDRNVVWRSLGDAWFETWTPRIEAVGGGLELRAEASSSARSPRCPSLGDWLEAEQAEALAEVGLDPERSQSALTAALARLEAPETGAALVAAIESDLALACSAPLISLLHAGPHALALDSLAERLTQVPELSASAQLQLQAEVAAAAGDADRARLATISAAAESPDPRAVWARAAVAGRSFGVREYTLEALRQVLLLTDGLDDPAAQRELVLTRVRDVDADAILRDGDTEAVAEVQAALQQLLEHSPTARRWARLDELLWTLAGEPRADALAWTRLGEILAGIVDDQVAARHPAAMAALDRASQPAEASPPADVGARKPAPELALLGDTDAICALAEANRAGLTGMRLVGAATACDPRRRAEALSALLERVEGDPSGLRAHVLAGPVAVGIDPLQPGVLRSQPTLTRAGAALRVAFGLPLAPIWVTEVGPDGG